MDEKLYKFGMDWLNGIVPMSDVKQFFEKLNEFSKCLGLQHWEEQTTGRYNYRRRFCLNGKQTIQLAYNPVNESEDNDCLPEYRHTDDGRWFADMKCNNPGIFLSISGDGIRELCKMGQNQSTFNNLMQYLFEMGFRATRFDVYCDILDKNNKIVPLIIRTVKTVGRETTGKPEFCTNLQRFKPVTNESKLKDLSPARRNFQVYQYIGDDGKPFHNCQVGTHDSRFGMCRVYNKYYEVRDGRLSKFSDRILKEYGVDDYWYRIEYEVHKENAAACFNAAMDAFSESDRKFDFKGIFSAVAVKLFRIVVAPTRSITARSAPLHDVWADFMTFCSQTIHFV